MSTLAQQLLRIALLADCHAVVHAAWLHTPFCRRQDTNVTSCLQHAQKCLIGGDRPNHSAMREGQEKALAAPQAQQAKETKYGRGVAGIPVQLSGRCGPGLETLASLLATSEQSARWLARVEGDRFRSCEWCRGWRWRGTTPRQSSRPQGTHNSLRGTQGAQALFLSCFVRDKTTPRDR